ncbi:MAG: Chaperone SurA [Hyphomicrobiaceae bacterium hypho_1]
MTFCEKYNLISMKKKKVATIKIFRSPYKILILFLIEAFVKFEPVYAHESEIPGLIVNVPSSTINNSYPSSDTVSPLSGSNISGTNVKEPPLPTQSRIRQHIQSVSKVRSNYKDKTLTHKKHAVAILVNDEPITHHEIDQRTHFMSINSDSITKKAQAHFRALIKQKSTTEKLRKILDEIIGSHPYKSRDQILSIFEERKKSFAKLLQRQALLSAKASVFPAQEKRAQKELIEERLQMQEAQRLNVLASPDEVDRALEGIAKRNKLKSEQFLANLRKNGVGAQTFKDKIRAQLSWGRVIRRRFGRSISVSMAEVDDFIAKESIKNNIKLRVHKLVLRLPPNVKQTELKERLREGERLKARFSDCRSTNLLIKDISRGVFQDLGLISVDEIQEPARSLMIKARNGEMLSPLIKKEGVVLYAVCQRDTMTTKDRVKSELQRREFNIMGRRYLTDLKRDAHIEYR